MAKFTHTRRRLADSILRLGRGRVQDGVNSSGSFDCISYLYQWSMAMLVCVLSCLTHRSMSGIAGHRVWNDIATTKPKVVITVHLGVHIDNRDPLDVLWECVLGLHARRSLQVA